MAAEASLEELFVPEKEERRRAGQEQQKHLWERKRRRKRKRAVKPTGSSNVCVDVPLSS